MGACSKHILVRVAVDTWQTLSFDNPLNLDEPLEAWHGTAVVALHVHAKHAWLQDPWYADATQLESPYVLSVQRPIYRNQYWRSAPKNQKCLKGLLQRLFGALAKTNCSTAPQMFSWDVTPLFSVNLESHLSGRFWGWTFSAVWKKEAWPGHRQLWPQKSRAVHGWRVANGWIASWLASRDMMSYM